MKYSQGIKEIVNRQIPVGGCVKDTAYVIAGEILVAVDTYAYAASTLVPFVKRGCVALPPKSGDVPAAGGPCYLDASTGEVQATASATVYLCGTRDPTHPYDNGTTLVGVDLDGTTAAVYGVPGDITGVTAGTGITGGGTSGNVTVAADFGTGAGKVCEGNDARLSDARSPTAHAGTHATGQPDALAPGDIGAAVAADTPTMAAAAAGAGLLIESAGADKTQAASGIATADVVTAAAAASGAGLLVVSAGANKEIETSELGDAWINYSATLKQGMPFVLEVNVEAAVAVIDVFNANAPFDFQITDFHVLCTATNAGGSAKLNDAAGGGGNDITDAVSMAVQDTLSRCSTLVGARKVVLTGGSLSVVKNAAGDSGKVYIYAVVI